MQLEIRATPSKTKMDSQNWFGKGGYCLSMAILGTLFVENENYSFVESRATVPFFLQDDVDLQELQL